MRRQHERIDHHAHAREEDDRKEVLKGNGLSRHAMAELGTGNHHARQEGAKRHGEVEKRRREHRRTQCDDHYRELEELARAEARDTGKQPGEHARAHHEHERHEGHGLAERETQLRSQLHAGNLPRTKHHGKHDQDDDRRQILHDEPARCDAATLRLVEAGVREVLDEHHGRGDRHGKAEHHAGGGLPAKRYGEAVARAGTRCDLQHSAGNRHALNLEKIL